MSARRVTLTHRYRVAIGLSALALSCSATDDQSRLDANYESEAPADGAAAPPAISPDSGTGSPLPTGPSAPPDEIATISDAAPRPPTAGSGAAEPGVLTAAAWDDNRNFDFFAGYRRRMGQLSGVAPFRESDFAEALANFGPAQPPKQTLDVALVIDTTGSMGDEIAYLQAEFIALSDTIADKYPNADQRWSLVVYRDLGDEYVVRSSDFTLDREAFQEVLGLQRAGGGGDTPEAPEAGLAALAQLAWRVDESTARLAFWLADAPHHEQNASPMARAVEAVATAGVHLYPVASSGVDELTELTMRSAAQLTGGRYLFLTDDSGVGGAHKEPTLPCYFVTRLDDAVLRMVDIELTGEYREPLTEEVLRTGGDPENGRCRLESGETVLIY